MYGNKKGRKLSEGQIPYFREKWASISEYVKVIKQSFSRFYNNLHHRKGFFWSERFKSVIVDNGDTLINCLAYIDLNPVRAGLVEKPEEYRTRKTSKDNSRVERGLFVETSFRKSVIIISKKRAD